MSTIDEPYYARITMTMDSSKMIITLPYTEDMAEDKFYRMFQKYLNSGSFYTGRYEISKTHHRWVLETLRCLYDGVWEDREYSNKSDREVCDTRCEDAEFDDCECSCGGKYHGGGGDWQYVIGTRLVGYKESRKIVTRWYYSFDPSKVLSIYPSKIFPLEK